MTSIQVPKYKIALVSFFAHQRYILYNPKKAVINLAAFFLWFKKIYDKINKLYLKEAKIYGQALTDFSSNHIYNKFKGLKKGNKQ